MVARVARVTVYEDLKKFFFELRFRKNRRLVRVCLLLVIFITVFRIVLDDCAILGSVWNETVDSMCIKDLDHMIERRWILCAVQLPICVIWFCITFQQLYFDHIYWLPATFLLLYGSSAMAITTIGKEPETAVYMGYLFMVWIFTRIPFWVAFCISSATLVSWVIALNSFQVYQEKAFYSFPKWVVDFMYLVGANISLAYAAYSWESIDRAGFVESQVATHIRSSTQNLLNQLIPAVVQERILRQVIDSSFRGNAPVSYYNPIADEATDVSILFF